MLRSIEDGKMRWYLKIYEKENNISNRIKKKYMDKQREKEELLEEIEKAKERECLVVVEGKNDKAAFLELGFKEVFAIDKMALYRVVEEVMKREKEVIIMTDLDKEGKKLYRYFYTHLT